MVPVRLGIVYALVAFLTLSPAAGQAQDATSVGGLEQGERDTMRLDLRMKGREEQVVDTRINDQKIGYEERRIRLERRAEELLRVEEAQQQREQQWAESQEEERARARRREEEDIQRKKRTVDVTPDL